MLHGGLETSRQPLFLRDEELRQGIELMFYAYRDFTFESDQQLKRTSSGGRITARSISSAAIPARRSAICCRS